MRQYHMPSLSFLYFFCHCSCFFFLQPLGSTSSVTLPHIPTVRWHASIFRHYFTEYIWSFISSFMPILWLWLVPLAHFSQYTHDLIHSDSPDDLKCAVTFFVVKFALKKSVFIQKLVFHRQIIMYIVHSA